MQERYSLTRRFGLAPSRAPRKEEPGVGVDRLPRATAIAKATADRCAQGAEKFRTYGAAIGLRTLAFFCLRSARRAVRALPFCGMPNAESRLSRLATPMPRALALAPVGFSRIHDHAQAQSRKIRLTQVLVNQRPPGISPPARRRKTCTSGLQREDRQLRRVRHAVSRRGLSMVARPLPFVELMRRFYCGLRREDDLRPGMSTPCLVHFPRFSLKPEPYPRIHWHNWKCGARFAMHMMSLSPLVKGLGLPKGYDMHHLCGNKACIETDHMVAITTALHRMVHAIRGRDPSEMGCESLRFIFGEQARRRRLVEASARSRAANPERSRAILAKSLVKQRAKRLAAACRLKRAIPGCRGRRGRGRAGRAGRRRPRRPRCGHA